MLKFLVIAGLILVLFKSLSAGVTIVPVSIPKEIDALLTRQANRFDVEPALVKAIAKVESNFKPTAKNPLDPSYGLMQITPMLAQDYGYVKDYKRVSRKEISALYDPEINTEIACRHLNYLSAFGYVAMVHGYNVGISGYFKGRRNQKYFNLVSKYHEQFKRETV